jgi:hypothetical protein
MMLPISRKTTSVARHPRIRGFMELGEGKEPTV